MKQINQLEMNLNARSCPPQGIRRARRQHQARWWFQQMHRVVDEAAARPPSVDAPEQASMPLERAA